MPCTEFCIRGLLAGISGGLAHPLRHPAEAAPPFAVFEGWELGISGAKLLQKDRLIRVQGTRDHLFDLGSMDETCANSCQAPCAGNYPLTTSRRNGILWMVVKSHEPQ